MLADASSLHAGRWAGWFAGRGHRVMLASLEEPRGIRVQFARLPGRSRWLDYMAAVPALRKEIREFRPDLVNAHFVPNYGLMGAMSGFRPLAVSAWGSDLLVSAKRSILHRARVRWALSRADLATCDGRVLVDELSKSGVAPGRILNVPMGVDRELIAGRRGGIPNQGPLRIISTRSLEPVYDVETVIRAMPLVAKGTKRPVKLTVAGGGSLRGTLELMARELGVDAEFTGALEHGALIRRLDQADVYVTASRSDSTSVSLLEAMARGLVPVAGDIPGNREWIDGGANGLLFTPGDHAGLAEKIADVAEGRVDGERMISENVRVVSERGCWQDNMEEVEDSFLKLLNR